MAASGVSHKERMKRLITAAVGCTSCGFLLTACLVNSRFLALKCTYSVDIVTSTRKTWNGPIVQDKKNYTSGANYLIDSKLSQVRLWHIKEGSPLVPLPVKSFGTDFITWGLPNPLNLTGFDVSKDDFTLDRNTLEISGEHEAKSIFPAGYNTYMAFSGSCKEIEIPWEKLKPNN